MNNCETLENMSSNDFFPKTKRYSPTTMFGKSMTNFREKTVKQITPRNA